MARLTLNQRLLLLLALFVAGMLILQASSFLMEKQVNQKVVFPNFENQVLGGHKGALKSLVDAEAQILAQRIKLAKTREEQVAIITAETDAIRFFDDHSGYFFSYDMTGIRVNVPINKSANGKNCIDLKDTTGFPFVQGLVEAVKTGDGFLQYHFEKEGKGVQPKLSYVAMIPGTDIFVGAGVYIDDVQAERAALEQKVKDQSQRYLVLMGILFITILGITVAAALLLSRSITKLVKTVADDLLAGAGQVAMASSQLRASSQSLAEGASEQAASIEETSSSLEETSSMTRRTSENVNTAKELTKQTRTAADHGATDMQAMSQAMEAIKVSSNDIAKIIKAIDEIAFQTNILALNAAVEAARAGEAGMGFAVVADEVRNLAQRSAQAAKETAAKIESAIGKSNQGVEITNKVAMVLNEIVTKARQVDELTAEIATASHEQSDGIGQINIAVGQMDKITQTNAANAEESAASAEELNAQAETMKHSVAELLQLVGGQNRTEAVNPATSSGRAKAFNTASPKTSRRNATNGHGNGNGHAPEVLPGAGNRKPEIPREGDFKDF
ncbi:MAG: methyl-accepting chemotaxis protein [Verrucomicrobiae bacterium]|nr:methyl-accepting chemotaxis protein [Verrucomicrobiae bacterium]